MSVFDKLENAVDASIDKASASIDKTLQPARIAKRVESEMHKMKLVAPGGQFAPTLYTVFVSPQDDEALFGFYATLTVELESYLHGRGTEAGLSFDGRPLVRFFADENMAQGKFAVAAELLSAEAVAQLRLEEAAYLNGEESSDAPFAAEMATEEAAIETNIAALSDVAPVAQPIMPVQPAPITPGITPIVPAGMAPSLASTGTPAITSDASTNDGSPDTFQEPTVQDGDSNVFDVSPDEDDDFDELSAEDTSIADAILSNSGGIIGDPANQSSSLAGLLTADVFPPQKAIVDEAMLGKVADGGSDFDELPADAAASPDVANLLNTAGTSTPATSPAAPLSQPAQPAQPASDAYERPTAYLRNRADGKILFIFRQTVQIGRDLSNFITINDPAASRVNSQLDSVILSEKVIWRIRDLDSKNGTFVNNVPVREAALVPGDVIRVGKSEFEYFDA